MTARARGAADPTRADARVPKNEAGLVTPQTSAYAELPPMRVPEGSGGARFPHLGDSLTAFRAGRSRRATPSQPPMRCARDDPHRGPIAAFIRCTMPIVGPRWGRVGNSMGNTHYVTMAATKRAPRFLLSFAWRPPGVGPAPPLPAARGVAGCSRRGPPQTNPVRPRLARRRGSWGWRRHNRHVGAVGGRPPQAARAGAPASRAPAAAGPRRPV